LSGARPGGKPCLGLEKEVAILAAFALYYWGHPVEVGISAVAIFSAELLHNEPFSALDVIGRFFLKNLPVFAPQ
jgi:hypothetical protein